MPFQPPLSGLETLFAPDAPMKGQDLASFPHVPKEILSAHGKWLGRAGELLVESVLLRTGLLSTMLPEFMPADCVIYHPAMLLRLQIKTASRPRDGSFHFNVSKGYHRSPGGVRRYAEGDYDILALVALSENVVKFSTDRRSKQSFCLSDVRHLRERPRRSLDIALDELGVVSSDIGSAPTSFIDVDNKCES